MPFQNNQKSSDTKLNRCSKNDVDCPERLVMPVKSNPSTENHIHETNESIQLNALSSNDDTETQNISSSICAPLINVDQTRKHKQEKKRL